MIHWHICIGTITWASYVPTNTTSMAEAELTQEDSEKYQNKKFPLPFRNYFPTNQRWVTYHIININICDLQIINIAE